MRRRHLLLFFALVAVSCSSGGGDVSPPGSTGAGVAEAGGGPSSGDPSDATALSAPPRLGSHLFMAVGDSRSIAGFGELLEVLAVDEGGALVVDGDVLTATSAGISCLRFRYRQTLEENAVQTVCVVAFDETGDCLGSEPLHLDLERFLEPGVQPAGNSDLLVGGTLYSACVSSDGRLRLQQPEVELPDLYFAIVDALGGGPYSLGDDEFAAQRAGFVTTYDGLELSPPWMVTVSREVSTIELQVDGTFVINDEECSEVPSCTDDPSLVQPGDIFRTSLGLAPDQLQAVMESADSAVLDGFVMERIGVGWDDVVGALPPEAVAQVFNRLATLEVLGDLLEQWDGQYGLRENEIVIGYWQPWFVEQELTVLCGIEEAAQLECERFEVAISRWEGERIAAWRNSGLHLWQAGFLGVSGRLRQADRRPHWSAFEGVMGGIGGEDLAGLDQREAYDETVKQFAAEIGVTTPVMLYLSGGPISAQTTGVFCEAEICPSDFFGAYEMAEGALYAALDVFSVEQFRGFAVATFEGAHFDIREPYETSGFPLNRIGETGYNHPILNVWRASNG